MPQLMEKSIYKYPIQKYVDNRTKIQIYCSVCEKPFAQIPNDHLRGIGCPTCGIKKRVDQRRHTLDDVRKKIGCCPNGEKYIIPDQEYVNTDTQIEIICPIHGSFRQTPHDHRRLQETVPRTGRQRTAHRTA